VEGIVGEDAPFTVEMPPESKGKLEIKVEGPKDPAKATVTDKGGGAFAVVYKPTEPGEYKVHVLVDGKHIPGSIFLVTILQQESLGGEGKIRVFYSTTSSSQKSRDDRRALETLLQAKKIHLRGDFEPWHAIDIFDREDRELIFRRAKTKTLPIVFIDDEYIGDYDKLVELEEAGKLDPLLNMKKQALISEDEHRSRLKQMGHDGEVEHTKKIEEKAPPKGQVGRLDGRSAPGAPSSTAPSKPPPSAPAGSGGGGGGGPAFCPECGAKTPGVKFCSQCGFKF